jgi:sec-independent protein translocase protein TatA
MTSLDLQLAGIGGLGTPELLVILGVAVLLFGGKKIPEVAKGLGEGIRNFKSGMKEAQDEKKEEKSQEKAQEKKEETVKSA